ncbi:MAG TPA: potassium-transporting ATPase subunit KdpC [Rhodanobacteraceae bacterium]|nr:potassium-transporting ATPase subunit KdpC [Rhodanobacteraceae bacterium]
MSKLILQSLTMLVAMTIVTGVAYPLLVTGAAQLLFHDAANGSVIERGGKPVGSELIGQPFADPKYFWSRPSATAPFANNSAASSGSNQGPTNSGLTDAVKQRIDALRAADPDNAAPVPVDLVTASGSGLDPDISPAAASYQIARVARARGMSADSVERLVSAATEGRQFGVLGEPRVNVLELNLRLDGTW